MIQIEKRLSRVWAFTIVLLMIMPIAGVQAEGAFTGTWQGAIEIPGMPLEVTVRLAFDESSWSGSVDIPAQGAAGIPLTGIRIDGDAAAFVLAGVPGNATFDGVLTGDHIEGTFSQAGASFPFTLARVAQSPDAGEAAEAREYTDPSGLFSFPIPTNWSVSEEPGYVVASDPDGDILMSLTVVPGDDPVAAVEQAWALVAPKLDLDVEQVLRPPSDAGIEETIIVNYRSDGSRIDQAVAQLHEGLVYILLIDADLAALQRRNAQVQIIASGWKVLALDEVDLSGVEPRPVGEVLDEFEAFVEKGLEAFRIPGAVIAVVQDGEPVYRKGFGVKKAGGAEPLTPDTHMMIGSTGKTMTTLLIASLVDDGILDWDTRVVDVLPEFAIADPELTEQMTIRHLLCACSGVPRRDFELTFRADELDAEAIVRSLATFEFFTDFGEAFQYSNQLVATGGYAAAAAAGAPFGQLYDGYADLVQARVFDPIGMADTTLSIERVVDRNNYAFPHQYDLETKAYVPIELDAERLLTPVAPAGAHWSTVDDMTQYLITQMNTGVTPQGTRIVSEENLLITREPQVPISATASYGLGWIVDDYKGLPVISHGGNTLGFTSEFTFLPTADIGIVVLTNTQVANAFTSSVQLRLLELVFELESEAEPSLAFLVEQEEAAVAQLEERVLDEVDIDAVSAHLGRFVNDQLGEISLQLEGAALILDAGWFQSELRPVVDAQGEPDGYMTYNPPFAGFPLDLLEDGEGRPIVQIGEGAVSYTFTQVE